MINLKDKKQLNDHILQGVGLETSWSSQNKLNYYNTSYSSRQFNKNLIGIAFSEFDFYKDSEIFESLDKKTYINVNTWFALNSSSKGFTSMNNIMNLGDYFAFILNPGNDSVLNNTYMKEQLANPEFYKDKNGLFTFKDPERIHAEDLYFMEFQEYILKNKIPTGITYLYKDIIENKDNYFEYFVQKGTKEQLETLISHFQNKKIDYPNKDEEKIKSVERYFYSPAFLLKFAKLPSLNEEQKEIVSFVLESRKLVEKIAEQSGKNGLYNKSSYQQQESKDIFLLAFHANNIDFIDVLISKNYPLNEHEITYILGQGMESSLPSLKLDISNEDFLLKNLQTSLFSINTPMATMFSSISNSVSMSFMTDEEIERLKKEHNSIKHDYTFDLLFNEGQKPGIRENEKIRKMYNEKSISLIDFLVLSLPIEIQNIKKQGIVLNSTLEKFIWETLIISQVEKALTVNKTTPEDFADIKKYFKDFLDNNSVYQNITFIEKAMNHSMQYVDRIQTINFVLEPILINKAYDYLDKGIVDDSFIKKYCTHNLFIYNRADKDMINSYLKEDKHVVEKELANVYFDQLPLNYNSSQEHELAQLIYRNKSLIDSVQEKRASFGYVHTPERMAKIEKALFIFKAQEERDILMANSGIQEMQPSHNKKRL